MLLLALASNMLVLLTNDKIFYLAFLQAEKRVVIFKNCQLSLMDACKYRGMCVCMHIKIYVAYF